MTPTAYIVSEPFHGTPRSRTALLPTGDVVHFSALCVTESPDTIQVNGVVFWYAGVCDGFAYYTADMELAARNVTSPVTSPITKSTKHNNSDASTPNISTTPTTTGDM